MRMYDLIIKKRDGGTLTTEEIQYFIEGVTSGAFPDEQTAAFLMAVFFRGMTPEETVQLTLCMARSGDITDLSAVKGVKVDKHSTGGVGDKTTLLVAPIVAACGLPVAKMSGRGLGHTGGTVDKLASIPGFRTELTPSEFIHNVNTHGLCVVGQSGDLAPADKKLYALRDVTGTVDQPSLIAASIMSKKIAAGADCILLDVKYGSGAFMKTPEEAAALAEAMVKIGAGVGRKTAALITGMSRPLGNAIGNALEVIEAADTLCGRGSADLLTVSVALAAYMLYMADKAGNDGMAEVSSALGTGKASEDSCPADCETKLAHYRRLVNETIQNGTAFNKLCEMVTAQGGDAKALTDHQRLPGAQYQQIVYAPTGGYVQSMDATGWGIASVKLGAGRETKESPIDYGAGIMLHKKTGDSVNAGEALAVLYTNCKESLADAEKTALQAITIGNTPPAAEPLIYGRVDASGLYHLV